MINLLSIIVLTLKFHSKVQYNQSSCEEIFYSKSTTKTQFNCLKVVIICQVQLCNKAYIVDAD